MEEQDSGGGFAPPSIEDVFGRRGTAPEPKAEGGQPEPQAPPPAAPETGEKPPAEQKPQPNRDEAGRFAPKQGEQQAGPPPEKHEPQNAPIAALKDERAKRQRAEQEAERLRAQLAAFQQQQARPAPPTPAQPVAQQPQQQAPQDFWADPEAFVKGVREQAVSEAEERMFQTRLALSEAVARREPDYEEAERALEAFAATSPDARAEIAKTLRTHPAPAMWALQAGRQLIAAQRWTPVMQQHSDPEAYINAEVERRLQERMAATPPQPAPSALPNLPVSLAGARNTAPRSGPGWSGPPSTQQLFGRRPR